MRGAGEDGLGAQLGALLARLQHGVRDRFGLRGLVAQPHHTRAGAARPVGAQPLREGALRLRGDGVRGVQHGLGGAVVVLERHDPRPREVRGEVEDVRRGGAAEAVDGLEVVADGGDVAAEAAQRSREVHLQAVDVLVLVDQHVVERSGEPRPDHLVARQRPPHQQQVVQVDHAELALARRVLAEQRRDRLAMIRHPREVLRQHLRQRQLGVDRARVQIEQRPLLREAGSAGRRVAGLDPQQVQHVGRVARVQHAEAGRQAQGRGVAPHQPVRHRMERPAHHPGRGGNESAGPLEHLPRGAPRERQQQDALGRHTLGHEPSHPGTERCRLARPRAGEDQQWPAAVRRGGPLLVIELVQPIPLAGVRDHCHGPSNATQRAGRLGQP